jgi:hypothetical protein
MDEMEIQLLAVNALANTTRAAQITVALDSLVAPTMTHERCALTAKRSGTATPGRERAGKHDSRSADNRGAGFFCRANDDA